MTWTFAKCLGHLLNVLDICKTTWTFTKRPGHLLNDLDIKFTKQPGYLRNVLVNSGLDWTGLWTGLDYSLSGIYCIGLPGSRLRH